VKLTCSNRERQGLLSLISRVFAINLLQPLIFKGGGYKSTELLPILTLFTIRVRANK
jgi:hypothetical protein